jgi:hypothetical protein
MSKIKTRKEIIAGLQKDLARTYKLDFKTLESSLLQPSRVAGLRNGVRRLDAALTRIDEEIKNEKRPLSKRKPLGLFANREP